MDSTDFIDVHVICSWCGKTSVMQVPNTHVVKPGEVVYWIECNSCGGAMLYDEDYYGGE